MAALAGRDHQGGKWRELEGGEESPNPGTENNGTGSFDDIIRDCAHKGTSGGESVPRGRRHGQHAFNRQPGPRGNSGIDGDLDGHIFQ